MSLHPQPVPPIPETTVATAQAAFPRGNRYMTMRDELGTLYTDQDFLSLYAVRGQPGFAPWRLALVLVFQFAEGLSDEQAPDAVRARIDWKYALSLDLSNAGFDASVLSEFRDRLITGSLELHLLDTMLARFKALGLLKPRGRQRTASTHVLAAMRALNRLQCVGETVRHVLNTLAVAAPDWLAPLLEADWLERYASRFDEYRLPKADAERQALAEQIGSDGRTLLHALYHATSPTWLRELPAVDTLRRVWLYSSRIAVGRMVAVVYTPRGVCQIAVEDVMIRIAFTDAERDALAYERYHHPVPHVQKRMEIVYLKSQDVAHQEIARLCRVSRQTVVTTLHLYQEGGIERLKRFHFLGQPSTLNAHQSSVEAHFRTQPPRSVAEAQDVIEQLTGIRRAPTQSRAFLKRMGMPLRKVASMPGRAHDPVKQHEQDTFQHAELEPRLHEVRQGKRTLFLSTPPTSSTEPF